MLLLLLLVVVVVLLLLLLLLLLGYPVISFNKDWVSEQYYHGRHKCAQGSANAGQC
jgi:hypothetical protein